MSFHYPLTPLKSQNKGPIKILIHHHFRHGGLGHIEGQTASVLIGRSNYLVEREVFGVVRPRERAQAADDELGGVGEAVEDDDAEARGEQLQHGVSRTRSRSETG